MTSCYHEMAVAAQVEARRAIADLFRDFCTRIGGAITRQEETREKLVLTCMIPRGRAVLRSLHLDKYKIVVTVDTVEGRSNRLVIELDHGVPNVLRFEGAGRLVIETSARTGVTDVVFYEEKPVVEELTLVVERRLGVDYVTLEVRSSVSFRKVEV